LTPKTRLIAITDPHNPTGVRAETDLLRDLGRLALAREAFLVVDEVYAPYDGLVDADGVWPFSARHAGPNVIAVSSLSKCYGFGDHRVGWLLAPAEIVRRARDAITASCGHFPSMHAFMGCLALASIQRLAERTRSLLRGRRPIVEAWLTHHPELIWSAPPSGPYGFARHTRHGDLTAAIERGAARHSIAVAPGSMFGLEAGFRIAWATVSPDKLPAALERLDAVLAEADEQPEPPAKGSTGA
jgi:aspartate/methionine/tyrosine aminotransferase